MDHNDEETIGEKWGLPLKDLYKLALNFYKGNQIAIFWFQLQGEKSTTCKF